MISPQRSTRLPLLASIACIGIAMSSIVSAVTINVDYRYDTSGYFSNPANACQKTALDAAAARWSNVLDANNLIASSINDTNDGRIGFSHPSTGANWDVSGAASAAPADDFLVSLGAAAASEYRAINWSADEWILYPGARAIASAGQGGTASGTNLSSVFTDQFSHLNRDFSGFDAAATSMNLPTWGGSITFSSTLAWSCNGDFYSVALHEIGHALGLSSQWNPNTTHHVGNTFIGPMTLMAANMDNGTSLTSLNLEPDAGNYHWLDNNQDGPDADTVGGDGPPRTDSMAIQSFIFPAGSPDYSSTVGAGTLQDLLMEPTSNQVNPVPLRFELTNVDVASAKDIGWSTIPVPEPNSPLLFVLGAFGLLSTIRRR